MKRRKRRERRRRVEARSNMQSHIPLAAAKAGRKGRGAEWGGATVPYRQTLRAE